jgi:hypothetical protein
VPKSPEYLDQAVTIGCPPVASLARATNPPSDYTWDRGVECLLSLHAALGVDLAGAQWVATLVAAMIALTGATMYSALQQRDPQISRSVRPLVSLREPVVSWS